MDAPESPRIAHSVLVVIITTAALLFTAAHARSADDPDAPAQRRLEWMRANQRGMWNVDANEGAFLRDQVIKLKAKRILEVGTSNGYSTIWLATGARQTLGRVTTLEIDAGRASLARENFRAAGVDAHIHLIEGDARKEIPKLQGPFEVVFIDAWKPDYVQYLDMVLPMVPPGGVILAHNTTNLRSELLDFIERVKTDPRLRTTFVEAGPGGLSVSVKQAPK